MNAKYQYSEAYGHLIVIGHMTYVRPDMQICHDPSFMYASEAGAKLIMNKYNQLKGV